MAQKFSSDGLSRREALALSAAALFGSPTTGSAAAPAVNVHAPNGALGTLNTPSNSIASTSYGKVRGYVEDGVFVFKGIPYGADTGGANRWLPAKRPQTWSGERPTLVYGANAPQQPHWWNQEEASFLLQWDDWYSGEDVLKLNVWTPQLSGKHPVMVYLHGGAFFFGSSHELPSQDGARLARHHNVVSVTVGHRLNVLGFLDVAEIGGPAYADSGNVGMTDLVFALQWVRENIANFGGDPNNVMIYGQSGGGAKVLGLMGMPTAAGLFHRAAIQSAGLANFQSAEESRALSRQVINELGLQPHEFAKLQDIEWSRLNAAGNAAIAKRSAAGSGERAAFLRTLPGVAWGPSVDGRVVPTRPFIDGAPEISKHIPLLIGSVTEEGFPIFMGFGDTPSEAQWRASLKKTHGDAKADALINAMKSAHPGKPIPRLAAGVAGLASRNAIQRMVAMRYDQGGAPVFQYLFSWQSPQLDGRGGAWHTLDLAFCFDNTKRCAQGTGNTAAAQTLAKKMTSAWAAFARSGDPSTPELQWSATDPRRVQTMIFDDRCRMEDDPDAEARKILQG